MYIVYGVYGVQIVYSVYGLYGLYVYSVYSLYKMICRHMDGVYIYDDIAVIDTTNGQNFNCGKSILMWDQLF